MMVSLHLGLLLATLVFSPSTLAIQVQKSGLQLPPDAGATHTQIKQIFTDAFNTYTKFAFGHDDLTPITQSFLDDRNGWGATIVDSMSTMKIMGLEGLFQTALGFSSKIDFSQPKTPDTVSVFESTTRYVGGLLLAYLLNDSQPKALVDKVKQLTDKLKLGFNRAQALPFGFVDFLVNQPVISMSNIAEAGSLAEGAVKHIVQLSPPLPGLVVQGIDPSSGSSVGAYVTWGGGSGSYFDYLLKHPQLNPNADPALLQTWQTAVDSSIKWLLKVSTVGDWTYLADLEDDRKIRHISSQLACFAGGNWILGGQLLSNQTIVNFGLKLTDACWNKFASTATNLGSEVFGFISTPNLPPGRSDDGLFTGNPVIPEDRAFNTQNSFYIFQGASDYILRSEMLESNFYAWRVTGDPKYLDNAKRVVRSFIKFLTVPNGQGTVSGVMDVNNANIQPTDRVDNTQSFFFSSAMKYLYLTFDDPTMFSLDDYVFSSEGHPFKAPPLN